MPATTTHARTMVECSCKVCAVNAAKLGLTLPLRAECTATMATAMGRDTHGIVYIAFEPGPLGAAARRCSMITPAPSMS